MRTTIEIPDDLFRRAKARAALDGLKLKDLITRFVEQGLRETPQARRVASPRNRSPLPVIPEAETSIRIPAMTRAELASLELEDDLAKHDRSARR